jgi:GNAT superfamily N-acetyltransferase
MKMVDNDVAKELVKNDSFLTFDDRTLFFGYYYVGELIGVIGYKYNKSKTRIKSWYVKPEYRNQGYGTKMLKYVLQMHNTFDCFATGYSYNIFKKQGFIDIRTYKNGVTYMRLEK